MIEFFTMLWAHLIPNKTSKSATSQDVKHAEREGEQGNQPRREDDSVLVVQDHSRDGKVVQAERDNRDEPRKQGYPA